MTLLKKIQMERNHT